MQGTFVVYVLRNPQKKRYIGITSNLDKRIREHNEGVSRYTRMKGPWHLAWKSRNCSHKEALKLEKLMKRQKGGIGLSRLMLEYEQGS